MSWRVAAGLVALSLALSGCESTQEKSAQLEREAKSAEHAVVLHLQAEKRLLTIEKQSSKIVVSAVTLLKGKEGDAVVVTLQNRSATALREVPVRVVVHGAGGRSLYTNETAGQSHALISASLIPAHGTLDWIDDQVQLTGGGAQSATAEVGEAAVARGSLPSLTVTGTHLSEGASAEGEVVNHSTVTQTELVVYAVARRGGRIVAAGRALVPSARAGSSTRFQLFFVGNPQGAALEVSAPPSTLG